MGYPYNVHASDQRGGTYPATERIGHPGCGWK